MQNKKQQIVINEIIKKIYYIDDYDEMRQTFVDMIGSVIKCKAANFYLTDSDEFYHPPVSNFLSLEDLLEYLNDFEDDEITSWFYKSGKSMVYREKDMFDISEIENGDFYKYFCLPRNIHDVLMTCLAINGEYVGIISIFRESGAEEFSEDDVFTMELLKEHLECRHMMEMRNGAFMQKSAADTYMHFIKKYSLTIREAQILELLLDGQSNDYISDKLTITSSTVKKHLLNIYKKLGITRRIELIKFK